MAAAARRLPLGGADSPDMSLECRAPFALSARLQRAQQP